MILKKPDYQNYLSTHLALLLFTGKEKNIVAQNVKIDDFLELKLDVKLKCREALLADDNIYDQYIAIYKNQLTTEQVAVVSGFKKKICGTFVILKCLAKHAIFLDTNCKKYYAVTALGDPFINFYPRFPVFVKAVLLPFNNKIIYDGFLENYNINLGRNMANNMIEDYKLAKQNNQIITNL